MVKTRKRLGHFYFLWANGQGLSIREPGEAGITDVRVISGLALKRKMLDATWFFPEYKSFKNKLTTKKPSKWLAPHAGSNCR